ncbi:MAG: hypothetical protein WDO16_15500 [Bacteroidota bacterium]
MVLTASTATVSVPDAQAVQSGKYYVLVTNADNCTHLDSVTVTVNINPVAATPFNEFTICEGDNVGLTSSGGGDYKWIPATGLSSNVIPDPVATPVDTTAYQLIITNQFTCRDTADVTIYVVEKARANAGPDKTIIKGNAVHWYKETIDTLLLLFVHSIIIFPILNNKPTD